MMRTERVLSRLAGGGVAVLLAAGIAMASSADDRSAEVLEAAMDAEPEAPSDVVPEAPAELEPEPEAETYRGPERIGYAQVPHGPALVAAADDASEDDEEPEPAVEEAAPEPQTAEQTPAKKDKTEAQEAGATADEKPDKRHGTNDKRKTKRDASEHDGWSEHSWWPHGHAEVDSCALDDGGSATVDWRGWLYGGDGWTLVDTAGAASVALDSGKVQLTFTGTGGEVDWHDDVAKVKVRAQMTVERSGDVKQITLKAWTTSC